MNITHLKINRLCECLHVRKGHKFVRGQKYMVKSLYQDIDGDLMIEVVNGFGETVNCFARRFKIFVPY